MGDDQKEFVHIGQLLKTVLRTCRPADMHLAGVWKIWDQAVGPAIAENARPQAFKQKLLLVQVSSPVWIQQLRFLKKDLIAKLNQALGEACIEDIKFKIGGF
jgi:predicted nucleic acid-binding Zn ribbon protein